MTSSVSTRQHESLAISHFALHDKNCTGCICLFQQTIRIFHFHWASFIIVSTLIHYLCQTSKTSPIWYLISSEVISIYNSHFIDLQNIHLCLWCDKQHYSSIVVRMWFSEKPSTNNQLLLQMMKEFIFLQRTAFDKFSRLASLLLFFPSLTFHVHTCTQFARFTTWLHKIK